MSEAHHQETDGLLPLQGMYQDYFLDYASYVILERAVPAIEDGLKPVQRRILHAMKEMDDGRYHKVANIIGQTMQYHPHGDAAIGDALVNLGQKDLLIDTQGNWGNILTGDSAAAPRYIEARLTRFALEVAFNPQTTEWQLSYDGRKREPLTLPMKFPLLLAHGAEGIAVGLSTKILPHNFIELILASIAILEGKHVDIYPDFPTGGIIDVADYQKGRRGGRIKARARLEKLDKNLIAIRELPYGVTTTSLIESIIKANDKGKIKIKQVTDNTAQEVEVLVELAAGVSPDVAMDALYAFSDCEVSISPNACVIIEEKPHFLSVEEILEKCTFQTRELLRRELEIRQHELLEKWHLASLEKIFIEKRIYHDIEACESWEEVLDVIDRELRRYVACPSEHPKPGDPRLRLMRDITRDDIAHLTEIKIKHANVQRIFRPPLLELCPWCRHTAPSDSFSFCAIHGVYARALMKVLWAAKLCRRDLLRVLNRCCLPCVWPKWTPENTYPSVLLGGRFTVQYYTASVHGFGYGGFSATQRRTSGCHYVLYSPARV
ncbi:MAG: DNA gyrase subunit A, partial [Haliscomenobacter sp.]